MHRSSQLAPLSREHHVALEVALRLSRATDADVTQAVTRFADFWQTMGRAHFDEEERLLLPALAGSSAGAAGGERMQKEHEALRQLATVVLDEAPAPTPVANRLGDELRDHVRFEERELFPLLEQQLTEAELDALGRALTTA
jgi:hemerythrin-like domain-containing protein